MPAETPQSTPATAAGTGWAGFDIRVERDGRGPTIIFTHGFNDSADSWQEQVPALAEQYTVVRWDLLGHGRSAKPDTEVDYHRDRAVEELTRLAEAGDPPVVLVGHSVGGFLSNLLTLRRPELVRALIMLSTGPGFRKPEAREKWNTRAQGWMERYDTPFAAWRLLEQHDSLVIDHLDQLAIPTLVLSGDGDKGYGHILELYQRKIPGVESVVIEGAGHYPHMTHGAAVTGAIQSFLERRL